MLLAPTSGALRTELAGFCLAHHAVQYSRRLQPDGAIDARRKRPPKASEGAATKTAYKQHQRLGGMCCTIRRDFAA